MTMTVTEANAVNVVARHVLATNAPRSLMEPFGEDDLRDALGVLLRGANRRLMAGMQATAARELPLRHPVEE